MQELSISSVSPYYNEMTRQKRFVHYGLYGGHIKLWRLNQWRLQALEKARAAGDNYLVAIYSGGMETMRPEPVAKQRRRRR